MAGTDVSSNTSMEMPEAGTIDMKLEVVTLPVSDVDQAKRFYQSLGWRLDADIAAGDNFRAVQLTPPHSPCSIAFGKGLTTGEPGSVQRLLLAVCDIDTARADLVSRGVQVSEVFQGASCAGTPALPPALARGRERTARALTQDVRDEADASRTEKANNRARSARASEEPSDLDGELHMAPEQEP